MSASSQGEIDAASRMRFSPHLLLSTIAVAVMAVAAVAFIVLSGGGPGAVVSDSPESTATAVAPSTTPTPTPTSAPSPTAPPSATSAPSPTPTSSPVAGWTGLTWSDPITPRFVVHLNDLLPWGDGYVAVGEVEVDATRSEAAFLTSPDGLNWSVRQQFDPGVADSPRHLVVVGDQLLAFSGPSLDRLGLPDAAQALIWSTDDGMSWSTLDSPSWRQAWGGLWIGPMPAGWDELQHDIPTGLVDVASGPEGLVAVGNSFGSDELIPVIMHSTDGRDWSRVVLPPDSPSVLVGEVVAFGHGFVLVGAIDAGPRVDGVTPAAWFSVDGMTWTRAAVNVDGELFPGGAGGMGEMGAVTAAGDGLIGWWGQRVMSAGGPRFTAAWASSDGRTWEPRDLNAVPSLRHAYVAGDGTRIVALGPAPNPAPAWGGISQVWASLDGVAWSELGVEDTVDDFVERVWVVPDGVIYAGIQSFWFGTPSAGEG